MGFVSWRVIMVTQRSLGEPVWRAKGVGYWTSSQSVRAWTLHVHVHVPFFAYGVVMPLALALPLAGWEPCFAVAVGFEDVSCEAAAGRRLGLGCISTR